MTYDYTRDFPEAKSTHYAMAIRLQKYWQPAGHMDVLYHSAGVISEVSRSNVFFFKGEGRVGWGYQIQKNEQKTNLKMGNISS